MMPAGGAAADRYSSLEGVLTKEKGT
eukprot:COSAG01_NODE_33349_length_565_cov_2.942060_1_plen_25_part_01